MKYKKIAICLILVILFGNFVYPKYTKGAVPDGFQTSLLIGSGLNAPTAIEFAPDGRLFILEQSGAVKIYKNGSVLPTPFTSLPAFANADRGLLGIAFDPEFNINHYVYFYYVDKDDLFHKIVRFNATGDVGTEGPVVIYDSGVQAGTNHAGGTIQFGPDGKLYLGIGDSNQSGIVQNLSNPFGKIIRINKDGTIPSDNPFVSNPNALPEIWALGFRNPFRFQFDSVTGQLYVGDVGESSWEEINLVTKGGNYGWPLAEGNCGGCAFINPIYTYFHTTAGYSVTGGPVYHASVFPDEYKNNLFFGDYAASFIKRAVLAPDGSIASVQDFEPAAGTVVDIKVGPDGALYYVTIFPGKLYRISYASGNQVPTAVAQADVTSGLSPLTVNFSSVGSFDPEAQNLSYEWDFGDGTTSTDENPIKTYNNNGQYIVQLKVSDGVNQNLAPAIPIQVGNPPTLNINSPAEGLIYRAGDTINYSADSSGSVKLDVLLHHNIHIHPFLNNLPGVGSFVIPTTGESSADTWYELVFTATDSDGLTTKESVRINPTTSLMTFHTSPEGLQILLDSQPLADGQSVLGVVGFKRNLDVANQTLNNVGYEFDHWSDGGNKKHTLTTPEDDINITAFFRVQNPFNAEYYNNQTLSGDPTLVRQDQNINFNWDRFSPDPSLPNDHFSARWTKQQYFSFGRYEFTTSTDDGARLYIDGNLTIDDWHNHGESPITKVVDLSEGLHEIKMEYYEDGGGAVARLFWDLTPDQPLPPTTDFNAQYFNNKDLSGEPVLTRTETEINNVWYLDSPNPLVNDDGFSARWIKTTNFNPGSYDFIVAADDGVRLYIDNNLVLDQWKDQSAVSNLVQQNMTAGNHEIKMEYYENTGNAVAKLSWSPTDEAPPTEPQTINGYRAEYFNNSQLLGIPKIIKDDPAVNFDWQLNSPDEQIPADQFSVRWTKDISFEAGKYEFTLNGDDGVRLFIDDELVIDGWFDQYSTKYVLSKNMSAGQHTIKIEYYENTGEAAIQFAYKKDDTLYTAEYFNNLNLEGDPVLTREEEKINHLFNNTSPDETVNVGNFSARWTKTETFTAGTYYFLVQSDDGIRVYVDDVLILDDWTNHALRNYQPSVTLSSGPHTLKIEYYQAGGGGVVIFK